MIIRLIAFSLACILSVAVDADTSPPVHVPISIITGLPAEEFVGPFPNWLNVKTDYGAAGNSSVACGGTDDTTSIQNALNAITESANTIYFPAGTYKITKTLVIKGKRYAHVIGELPSTTTIVWCGTASSTASATFTGTVSNNGTVNTLTASSGTGIQVGQELYSTSIDTTLHTSEGYPQRHCVVFSGSGTTWVIRCWQQTLLSIPVSESMTTTNRAMLWVDGIVGSKISRLTFDGLNNITVDVDHSKSNSPDNYFDVENDLSDNVFKNAAFGLRCGVYDYGCADDIVRRGKFLNNSFAGVYVGNGNALQLNVWDSLFDGNNYGATNIYGNGAFGVYDNVFKNSTTADVGIGNTGVFAVIGNYSSGSARFCICGGSQSLNNIYILDNRIIDTVQTASVLMNDTGPIVMIDNITRSLSGVSAGPIFSSTQLNADMFTLGNTFSVSSTAVANVGSGSRTHSYADTNVSWGAIDATEPTLPSTPISHGRAITEVIATGTALTDTNAVQSAIDGCVLVRCVVHLRGTFNISSTLNTPPNWTGQIVGDGRGVSVLQSAGASPVLRISGPTKAILNAFTCNGTSNAGDCVEVTNVDQAGSVIYAEQFDGSLSTTNVFVDALDNANVELHNFYNNWTNNNTGGLGGLKVTGGPLANGGAWAGGTVNIFAGDSSGDNPTYDISGGAHVASTGLWHDYTAASVITGITGTGVFTYAAGTLYAPANQSVIMTNFKGTAALVGLNMRGSNALISGDGTGGNVLGLAIGGPTTTFFQDTTAPADTYELLNTKTLVPNDSGSDNSQLTDVNCCTQSFIESALSHLRTNLPTQPHDTGAGITDLRMYEMSVSNARYGLHLLGPPTIGAISINNNSFSDGDASGTLVGNLSATMTGTASAFSGTWSLSTSAGGCDGTNGAGNGSFTIASGNQLKLNGTGVAGSYAVCVLATQAGTSNTPKGQALTITGNVIGGCAEATTFVGRALTAYPSFDSTHQSAVTGYICSLVSNSIWSKMDAAWVPDTQDASVAVLNLKSTSYTLVPRGTPTFTANSGYHATNGATGVWLDTQFTPSTAAGQYTKDSAHLMEYSMDNVTSSGAGYRFGGVQGTTANLIIQPRYSSGSGAGTVNSQVDNSGSVADGYGLYTAVRDSSTHDLWYKGTTVVVNNTTDTSTSLPDIPVGLLAWNDIGVGSTGNDAVANTLGFASIGGALTSGDVSVINTAICTYKTALSQSC